MTKKEVVDRKKLLDTQAELLRAQDTIEGLKKIVACHERLVSAIVGVLERIVEVLESP